jgi:hypothetical protein
MRFSKKEQEGLNLNIESLTGNEGGGNTFIQISLYLWYSVTCEGRNQVKEVLNTDLDLFNSQALETTRLRINHAVESMKRDFFSEG